MEVPYPLSTTGNCGHPRYKLRHNSNSLEFSSADNFLYKVLSVNPIACTLIIKPTLFRKDSCKSLDLGSNSFRIDAASPFNISSRNTVMLLNCSENILLSPLNCSSTSPCRQFEERVEQGKGCRNTICCSYLKDSSMTSRHIRLRDGGCSAYTSVVDLSLATPWMHGILGLSFNGHLLTNLHA